MDELTERVDEMLTHGKVIAADQWTVRMQLGCDEMLFRLLNDDVWRMVASFCYGNPSYPSGPGCDASGYRLSEDQVEAVTLKPPSIFS